MVFHTNFCPTEARTFLSKLIEDLCKLLGTNLEKVNTTLYHPLTDGLVENFNQTLKSMIAKHSKKFGKDWHKYVE